MKAGPARQTRAEPPSQSSNICINYLVKLGASLNELGIEQKINHRALSTGCLHSSEGEVEKQ